MSELDEFLAGERLDDVVIFISDVFLDADSRLRNVGTETADGVRVVVDGESGRAAFEAGTGMEAMGFAKKAMGAEGDIARTLDGGECPREAEAPGEEHTVEFVFSFAEAENPDVGGLYAEGDVVHAYAHCACGHDYSHKWVVGSRAD